MKNETVKLLLRVSWTKTKVRNIGYRPPLSYVHVMVKVKPSTVWRDYFGSTVPLAPTRSERLLEGLANRCSHAVFCRQNLASVENQFNNQVPPVLVLHFVHYVAWLRDMVSHVSWLVRIRDIPRMRAWWEFLYKPSVWWNPNNLVTLSMVSSSTTLTSVNHLVHITTVVCQRRLETLRSCRQIPRLCSCQYRSSFSM